MTLVPVEIVICPYPDTSCLILNGQSIFSVVFPLNRFVFQHGIIIALNILVH